MMTTEKQQTRNEAAGLQSQGVKIKFDITKNPPSLVDLGRARDETEARSAKLNRIWYFVVYVGGAVMLGVLIALSVTGIVAWSVAVAVAMAVAMAVGGAMALSGVVTVTVAMAVGGGMALGVAVGGAMALYGVVTLGYGLIVEAISDRRSQAKEHLSELTELGEFTPDECVKFVELVDADPTIAAYQQQLAAMGRKPVIGEYKVALEWMATSEKRASEAEKREQARLACERLTVKA